MREKEADFATVLAKIANANIIINNNVVFSESETKAEREENLRRQLKCVQKQGLNSARRSEFFLCCALRRIILSLSVYQHPPCTLSLSFLSCKCAHRERVT